MKTQTEATLKAIPWSGDGGGVSGWSEGMKRPVWGRDGAGIRGTRVARKHAVEWILGDWPGSRNDFFGCARHMLWPDRPVQGCLVAMKLRQLMFAIIGPLFVLLTYFGALEAWTLSRVIADAAYSREAAGDIGTLGDLVHELQKERGYSAGFTASGGGNFRTEMAEQRRLTDRVLSEGRTRLSVLGEDGNTAMRTALDGLALLRQTRAEIDTLAPDLGTVAGYYTGIINGLMTAQSTMAAGIMTPDLRGSGRVATYLGRAKEAAGLERAKGASGLGQETFPPALYNRYVALGAQQGAFLDLAGVELGQPGLLAELEADPEAEAVVTMRAALQARQGETADLGFGAGDWFAASTRWIDSLRGHELQHVNDMIARAQTLYVAAWRNLGLIAGLGLLISVAVLVLAIRSFTSLIGRVTGLTNAMKSFTEGDFDVWIPGIEDRDEIGAMADATYRFKQETLAMRRAAEERKADDEAAILGKAQRVVDLVTEGLSALAHADLSRSFNDRLAPEYDAIRTDFNTAMDRLRVVMAAIAETAQELDQSAETILTTSRDLADRTTRQVETIRDTNDRVSDLSARIVAYSEHVKEASTLASSARQSADRSGNVVRSAVSAMDRIAASSSEIGRILSLIEDIAFQTNLLALNAGVEAARAGESGRGFAVVASEVGALARRSGDATQEIKGLIEESGRHVSEGVSLVAETGDALGGIVAEIAGVDDVLDQVAAGAVTQADHLRSLAKSIEDLNQLAGRNMDVVDASGRSSGASADISKRLMGLIGDFKLDTGGPVMHAETRGAA